MGSSLEDCYTNVFLLTELSNLKWKKIVGPSKFTGSVVDDPILKAYSYCLSQEILAAWRRCPTPPHLHGQPVDLSLTTQKELWVFWYKEEPQLHEAMPAHFLQPSAGESGCYSDGVVYEARTLLFKALHNLLERALLSSGWLRFGRSFVEPVDADSGPKAVSRLITLSFFLHGENQVCLSVSVRLSAGVCRLAQSDTQQQCNVVLLPWGIEARLAGNEVDEADRLFSEWSRFYPSLQSQAPPSPLPKMLSVTSGGAALAWPSAFVVKMTSNADTPLLLVEPDTGLGSDGETPRSLSYGRSGDAASPLVSRRVQELLNAAAYDSVVNQNPDSGQAADELWSFKDSLQKTPCGCGHVSGAPRRLTAVVHTKAELKFGLPQTMVRAQRQPFHRRAATSTYASRRSPAMSPGGGFSSGAPLASIATSTIAAAPTTNHHPVIPTTSGVHSGAGGDVEMSNNNGLRPTPTEQPDKITTPPATESNMIRPPGSLSRPSLPGSEAVTPPSIIAGGALAPQDGHIASGGAIIGTPVGPETGSGSVGFPLVDNNGPASEPEVTGGGMDPAGGPPHGRVVDDFIVRPRITGAEPVPVRLECPVLIPQHPDDDDEYYKRQLGLLPILEIPLPQYYLRSDQDQVHHQEQEQQQGADPVLAAAQLNPGDMLNPAASLPEDFMAGEPMDSGNAPAHSSSSFLSPPASTERGEESPAPPHPPHHIAVKGGQPHPSGGHGPGPGPSGNPKTHPQPGSSSNAPMGPKSWHGGQSCVDYSKIYPTPPTLDPSDHLPSCVYEAPFVAYYDSFTATDFAAEPKSSKLANSVPQYQPKPLLQNQVTRSANGNMAPNYPFTSLNQRGYPPTGILPGYPTAEQYPSSVLSQRSIEMSPAGGPGSMRTPKTMESNLQSPMSNSSVAMHMRTSGNNMNNSVEQQGSAAYDPGVEVNALAFAVLLSDTFVNHFTDLNFDACTVCACQDEIRWESGVYGPQGGYLPSTQPRLSGCSCGFSLSRTRHLAVGTGLFFEDYFEILNAWPKAADPAFSTPRPTPTDMLADIVRVQARQDVVCGGSDFRADSSDFTLLLRDLSEVAWVDFSRIAILAFDQVATQFSPDWQIAKSEIKDKVGVGRAIFATAEYKQPRDAETLSVLKSLTELFRKAIVVPCGVWEAKNAMEGPVTWRSFFRRCYQWREHQSIPEPLPTLVAAKDKDWNAVSPQAICYWERLLLEPFSAPRDVAYVVMTPHDAGKNFFHEQVLNYFKEVTRTYEMCRFGKHWPFTSPLHQGLLRINRTRARKTGESTGDPNMEVDAWFKDIKTTHPAIASTLELYAQMGRYALGPFLTRQAEEKFLKHVSGGSSDGGGSSGSGVLEGGGSGGPMEVDQMAPPRGDASAVPTLEKPADATPTVVIYMVNPFPDNGLVVQEGLIRCYLEILSTLHARFRSYVQLQIVPISNILKTPEPSELKALSMAVYTQAMNVSIARFGCSDKSMTGFGPSVAKPPQIPSSVNLALNWELINSFRGRDMEFADSTGIGYITDLPHPMVTLFPESSSTLVSDKNNSKLTARDVATVLLVSYCLSNDQRYLIAAATDNVGSFWNTTVISLLVQDRRACRRGCVVAEATRRLWDWILGLATMSSRPWRLVVNRVGRLGPTELRAWCRYLSKEGLKQSVRQLREKCQQCAQLPAMYDNPSILTGCLVSLEPEPNLQLFPRLTTGGEEGRPSKNPPPTLFQPPSSRRDPSCTHILVFPTRAATSSEGHGHPSADDPGDDLLEPDLGMDIGLFDATEQDLTSIVNEVLQYQPGTQPGAVSIQLSNQPMALGYYISAGGVTSACDLANLPAWMRVHMPGPASVFRAALHVKADLEDEPGGGPKRVKGHKLDSNWTTDVLRYILEVFADLSWLNVDPATRDRRSCLPVHIQALVALYNAVQRML